MTKVGAWLKSAAITVAIFIALIPVNAYLNRPNTERLESARTALAEAGFPDARLSREQRIGNMTRCQVGQVFNKGRAYSWETDTHSGVFCQPEDGRPSSFLVDPVRAE